MNQYYFDEDHSDLEVRGEVIDMFGHRAGSFRDDKIFNKAGKLIGSVKGRYLVDPHGGRIADIRELKNKTPDTSFDTGIAALWLLSRQT